MNTKIYSSKINKPSRQKDQMTYKQNEVVIRLCSSAVLAQYNRITYLDIQRKLELRILHPPN